MPLALLLLPACGGADDTATGDAPALPPLQLAPLQAQLDALAAQRRPAPDDATLRELQEYADVALQLVDSDARTAALCERSLLAHERCDAVLVPALTHERPAVRARAAWLLGRAGRPLAQFALLLRLKDETAQDPALWIADALHRLGNDSALGWIDAALFAEQAQQAAGGIAVELLREDGAALSEQPTWDELHQALVARMDAWRATGRGCRDDATAPDPALVEPIVAAHLAVVQGTQLRPVDEARFVLTRSGVLALPLLRRALTAEEPYLRTMALQVLADLGPAARDCAGAVLPLLADPLTASYALRALGELGDPAMAPHLRARLSSLDTEQRAAAAGALGVLGDAASRPRLRALLQDATEVLDVRVQAAFALRFLGDDAEAEAFLGEREAKGDYHAPTLAKLRDRLAARR
ncbi:MAG: HEAT repeat domain-containing protein [Planctomycetota bacterium]